MKYFTTHFMSVKQPEVLYLEEIFAQCVHWFKCLPCFVFCFLFCFAFLRWRLVGTQSPMIELPCMVIELL